MKLVEKFPLGFWCTLGAENAPADEPKAWKELGCTLTPGCAYREGEDKAHFRAMLDAAYENGIGIILNDSRAEVRDIPRIGREGYRRNLEDIKADWGDHPAVWGIFLGDETGKEEYENVCFAFEQAHELMPSWQPYVNQRAFWPGVEKLLGFPSWDEYLDDFLKRTGMGFLSYDCYTQMEDKQPDGMELYFTNLRVYGEAARRNGVPFWTALLSVPHFAFRDPSLDDLRWQMNTALACGAQGILWFYIYQQELWISNYRNAPVNQVGRRTEKWYEISDLQHIFQRTLAPYLLKFRREKTLFTTHAWGGFPLLEEDEDLKKSSDDDMILTKFADDEGRKYVLCVNNSCEKSVNYTLRVRAEKVFELLADGQWRRMAGFLQDDGQIERSGGVTDVPHWYAPGQAVLFRYV